MYTVFEDSVLSKTKSCHPGILWTHKCIFSGMLCVNRYLVMRNNEMKCHLISCVSYCSLYIKMKGGGKSNWEHPILIYILTYVYLNELSFMLKVE